MNASASSVLTLGLGGWSGLGLLVTLGFGAGASPVAPGSGTVVALQVSQPWLVAVQVSQPWLVAQQT